MNAAQREKWRRERDARADRLNEAASNPTPEREARRREEFAANSAKARASAAFAKENPR